MGRSVPAPANELAADHNPFLAVLLDFEESNNAGREIADVGWTSESDHQVFELRPVLQDERESLGRDIPALHHEELLPRRHRGAVHGRDEL